MTHPGETAPGIPNGTRYLCPLCDWWLDVAPPDIDAPLPWPVSGLTVDDVVRRQLLDQAAAIEGALAGHLASVQHRRMGYGWGAWTAETLQACRCGHLRGDHFRHASSCLHCTDTETWACDCPEFEPR